MQPTVDTGDMFTRHHAFNSFPELAATYMQDPLSFVDTDSSYLAGERPSIAAGNLQTLFDDRLETAPQQNNEYAQV